MKITYLKVVHDKANASAKRDESVSNDSPPTTIHCASTAPAMAIQIEKINVIPKKAQHIPKNNNTKSARNIQCK